MHYIDEITTDTKYLLTHNEMFSVKKCTMNIIFKYYKTRIQKLHISNSANTTYCYCNYTVYVYKYIIHLNKSLGN